MWAQPPAAVRAGGAGCSIHGVLSGQTSQLNAGTDFGPGFFRVEEFSFFRRFAAVLRLRLP
jgi:hypothetical protein